MGAEEARAAVEFAGTERFEVLGCLGTGGMGVVYEVFDRARNLKVALKTLRRLSAPSLQRFKNEFRALADLRHPNLVQLGELFEERGQWFFTMELVLGVDLRAHLGTGAGAGATDTLTVSGDVPEGPLAHAATLPGTDATRLRAALVQLGRGLVALHDAHKVHRDVKPSNVLVTVDGRVLLGDFGLVVDLADRAAPGELVGTVPYMAPEQAAGQPVTAAADWYAVGAMLFEALTGRVPFAGAPSEVLKRKQAADAPDPAEIAPTAPPELVRLCRALLARDPGKRPSGRDVLDVISERRAPRVKRPETDAPPPFVGRRRELALLREAVADVQRGRPVQVVVVGASGLGKSSLVKQLLAELPPEALVLRGRCYERESAPYKALDGVVEGLERHLRSLDDTVRREISPNDAALAARLFPTLGSLAPPGEASEGDAPPDPQALRERAFAALRGWLDALARRGLVVVAIDDLQWADAESLSLAAALSHPPAPPLLLLCTSRPPAPLEWAAAPRTIELEPLTGGEAHQLSRMLLEGAPLGRSADTIAERARGHPMMIHELARDAIASGGVYGQAKMDELLLARAERCEPGARRLLELLALVDGPLATSAAARALQPEPLERALSQLRAAHLARPTLARGRDAIEPAHDQVREAVRARMASGELPILHRALAEALEETPGASPDALADHWHGAGEPVRAVAHARRAAELARAQLAFEREARLLRLVLALEPAAVDRSHLAVDLADALAHAGRHGDAARAYLEAAALAGPESALELKRRAAEALLHAAQIDQGLEVLRDVLAASGLRLARSGLRALAGIAGGMVWARLRGLGFRERPAASVPREVLRRIDVCRSVLLGLGMVDHVRSAHFQTIHLRLALRAGELGRVALAVCAEAPFAAALGQRRHAARLVRRGTALAERTGDPHARAMALFVAGFSAMQEGRWRTARAFLDRAEAALRACPTARWELATAQISSLWCLGMLGELDELSRRQSLRLREARDRGDVFAAVNLRVGIPNLAWLCRDEPDEARRNGDLAIGEWSQGGFYFQHAFHLIGRVHAHLYAGEPEAGLELLSRAGPAMRRSLVLRNQMMRATLATLRASCAINAAASGRDRDANRAVAARDARRLAREGVRWTDAHALTARAGLARIDGDEGEARGLLASAAAAYEDAEMALHAAAAQLQLARLQPDGEARAEAAEALFRAEQVLQPAKLARMLVPGFGAE